MACLMLLTLIDCTSPISELKPSISELSSDEGKDLYGGAEAGGDKFQ